MNTAKKTKYYFTQELLEFSMKLEVGALVPVSFEDDTSHAYGEFIRLVARESDETIRLIGESPEIEMSIACIPGCGPNRVALSWLFVNLIGEESLLYAVSLNLGLPQHVHDLTVLGSQSRFEFVFIGESTNSVIQGYDLSVQFDMKKLLDFFQSTIRPSWTWEEYLDVMEVVLTYAPTTEDLYVAVTCGCEIFDTLRS
jgi:hypothetical protein